MDGNSPGKRSLFLLSKFVVLTLWFHQPKTGMQTRDFNECYDHVKKYYNYNGL